jgi:hypothetical protein
MAALLELAGRGEASRRSESEWLDADPCKWIARAIGGERIRDTLASEGG